MQEYERIDLLLREIGQASEAISGIIRNGDDNWDIYLAEDVELNLAHDHEGQKLRLSGEVGTPSTKNLLQIYRSLLQFNSLSDETGGVVMSLGDDDSVFQTVELDIEVADLNTLSSIIENCAIKIIAWRTIFLSEAVQESTNSAESATFDPTLRV